MMKRSSSVAVLESDPFAGVDITAAADRLRALAHPDRLRLVACLLQGDHAVGELAEMLDIAQPTVSGHLRILQSRGLLTCRRDGHRIFYSVTTPALANICTCIRKHFGASASAIAEPA